MKELSPKLKELIQKGQPVDWPAKGEASGKGSRRRPEKARPGVVDGDPGPPASAGANGAVLSEHRTAVAFVEKYQGKLLFDHDRRAWFSWTGAYWKHEPTQMAFDFARKIATQLALSEDEKSQRSAGKSSFVAGVEKFARADRAFAVDSSGWDRDPFLLGTPSGTVDLRRGWLRPADPADRISKVTAVAPAANADCPRWRRFLAEATSGDEGMIHFLKQWCGYSLTGDTREHALVFGYGPGGNGKGVWISTITNIMKDYASTAAMDTFTSSGFDRHPTELAMLAGARLVTASETEEGLAWAEAKIKSMTGGDAITAHFMRQDNFTFTPTFKLMIVGNHKPTLHNVDDAMKRRLRIVPFIHKPATTNPYLADELRQEWPAILRWMIEGCIDWHQNGLTTTAAIAGATAEYFEEQDLVGQWMEEYDVEPGNKNKSSVPTDLYQSWRSFAEKAGVPPGAQRSFSDKLKAKGLTKGKSNGVRYWYGIRPKVVEDRDGNFRQQ